MSNNNNKHTTGQIEVVHHCNLHMLVHGSVHMWYNYIYAPCDKVYMQVLLQM